MDKNNVGFGIFFICLGVFAAILPSLGLLSPGEMFDPRIAPVVTFIGIVFLIMGLMSKGETGAVSQPIQPQPPQQVVRTLVICPGCGSRVSAEVKFCPECGTSLMPGKPQPT
ncbi:MAG: zinc-ribbon domain-containing protein [Candidatus Bathyarchaeota archaeon]